MTQKWPLVRGLDFSDKCGQRIGKRPSPLLVKWFGQSPMLGC
jgi:hypothetical protein